MNKNKFHQKYIYQHIYHWKLKTNENDSLSLFFAEPIKNAPGDIKNLSVKGFFNNQSSSFLSYYQVNMTFFGLGYLYKVIYFCKCFIDHISYFIA